MVVLSRRINDKSNEIATAYIHFCFILQVGLYKELMLANAKAAARE